MSFSCFSSFTVVCFASSSGNTYFFSAVSHCIQCSFLLPCNLPLPQLEPEIPVSSDWYQKLLWRLCPTKPGDKAVFFLTTAINIVICEACCSLWCLRGSVISLWYTPLLWYFLSCSQILNSKVTLPLQGFFVCGGVCWVLVFFLMY